MLAASEISHGDQLAIVMPMGLEKQCNFLTTWMTMTWQSTNTGQPGARPGLSCGEFANVALFSHPARLDLQMADLLNLVENPGKTCGGAPSGLA
jgi:hypothetical protein